MQRKAKKVLLAVIFLVLVVVAVLWIVRPYGATQAVAEYFRSTTVQMMPLPEGCVPTNETPPSNLTRIVEDERRFYRLSLQKVIVCRSNRRFPQTEPDFTNAAFSEETRKRWLPLYVGCCAYQFRRHIAVVVADVDERGPVIVEAALVQSRHDFLRLNWARKRRGWL
jgi:hypothetical protein